MRRIELGAEKSGRPIFMSEEQRGMHVRICGGTGRGKSTLMRRMILQDIQAGHGVCVIDPHGSLVNRVLCDLSETRPVVGRHWPVSIIEPGRTDFSTGFNPFSGHLDRYAAMDRIVAATLAAWQQFDQSGTPRMPRVLMMVFSLLAAKGYPLSDALILLQNKEVRARALAEGVDPALMEEWLGLQSLKPNEFRDYVDSASNRLFPFVSSSTIRRMFGTTDVGINFREKIEKRSIILVNLAESDYFTRRSADLVGGLIINDLVQSARLRSPNEPRPFYLYVDECARFLNDDIISALDETRKYGLHLTLAHQYSSQLKERGEGILGAALSIQNQIAFGGGYAPEDLEILAKIFFTGTIRHDEFIPGTSEPIVTGYEWEDKTSVTITHTDGDSFSDSESETEGEYEGLAQSISGGISYTPGPKQIEGPRKGERTTPSVWTYGGQIGKTRAEGRSISRGAAQARTRTESKSISVTHDKALVPIMGDSKGQRYTLEEQYERCRGVLKFLPRGKALIRVGDSAPQNLNVQAIPDPQTPIAQSLQQKRYEAFRRAIFARMVERGEALPSAEVDARILARQTKLRNAGEIDSFDETESFSQ